MIYQDLFINLFLAWKQGQHTQSAQKYKCYVEEHSNTQFKSNLDLEDITDMFCETDILF